MSGARTPLNLGVIADTHGLYDDSVEEHFFGVSEILHAGDIGARHVIDRLEYMAPVSAVSAQYGSTLLFNPGSVPDGVRCRVELGC
jgi:hypothetical protein